MPISLEFWELGCPKRGDAHITLTTALNPHPALATFRKEKRTGVEMRPAIFSGIDQFANSPRSLIRFIKILT